MKAHNLLHCDDRRQTHDAHSNHFFSSSFLCVLFLDDLFPQTYPWWSTNARIKRSGLRWSEVEWSGVACRLWLPTHPINDNKVHGRSGRRPAKDKTKQNIVRRLPKRRLQRGSIQLDSTLLFLTCCSKHKGSTWFDFRPSPREYVLYTQLQYYYPISIASHRIAVP